MNFTPQLPHSAPEQLNATRENHTSVRQDSWSIQGHQSQEILNTPSIKKYLQSGETCKEGPGDSEMNALDTGKGTSEGTKQIHQCRREPDKKSTLEAKRRENFNEVWLPLPFVSKPLFFFLRFLYYLFEKENEHTSGGGGQWAKLSFLGVVGWPYGRACLVPPCWWQLCYGWRGK